MIPEAAVEAAAIAICRADEEWSADDYYTRLARAALEAAAPHMSPSVDASAIIAELRLFNHREAAALIERFASR